MNGRHLAPGCQGRAPFNRHYTLLDENDTLTRPSAASEQQKRCMRLPSSILTLSPRKVIAPCCQKSQRRARYPARKHISKRESRESLDSSLAICLLGFAGQCKMYETGEYEEEVRKQAVMSEVLPDAEMWRKWEATEAPLRKGRGWYPALDRHFLELLVISEIQCLSHPLHVPSPNGQNDRIHRHASRVRRVACERIGTERLHAYCERVKEAFEAYVASGGWRRAGVEESSEDGEGADTVESDEYPPVEESADDMEGVEVPENNERGRKMTREPAVLRAVSPAPLSLDLSSETASPTMRIASPTSLVAVSELLVTPPEDEDRTDPFADDAAIKMDYLFSGGGSTMRIDLDDVCELDEIDMTSRTSSTDATDVSLAGSTERMDLDDSSSGSAEIQHGQRIIGLIAERA